MTFHSNHRVFFKPQSLSAQSFLHYPELPWLYRLHADHIEEQYLRGIDLGTSVDHYVNDSEFSEYMKLSRKLVIVSNSHVHSLHTGV